LLSEYEGKKKSHIYITTLLIDESLFNKTPFHFSPLKQFIIFKKNGTSF
jgi:hypothetical protein